MTKINISDFFDYSSKAVYEFLFVQVETEYEIIIPGEFVAGKDDNYCIATEYVNASYAGQPLPKLPIALLTSYPVNSLKSHFGLKYQLPTLKNWPTHYISLFRDSISTIPMIPLSLFRVSLQISSMVPMMTK